MEKNKSKTFKYYQKSAYLSKYNYALLYPADASEYMMKAAEHGYLKVSIKFVELQLIRISWISAKKSNKVRTFEIFVKRRIFNSKLCNRKQKCS